MKKELIYIGSVSRAFKAKEILSSNGIKSSVERGIGNKQHGCGYSVLIVEDDKSIAREILADNGLIEQTS